MSHLLVMRCWIRLRSSTLSARCGWSIAAGQGSVCYYYAKRTPVLPPYRGMTSVNYTPNVEPLSVPEVAFLTSHIKLLAVVIYTPPCEMWAAAVAVFILSAELR